MRPPIRPPICAARPPRTEHPHGARAAVRRRAGQPPPLLALVLLVAGTPLLDAHDYVDSASFPLLETHVPLWSGDDFSRPPLMHHAHAPHDNAAILARAHPARD